MKATATRDVEPGRGSGSDPNADGMNSTGPPIRTRPQLACHVCGGEGDIAYSALRDRLFGVSGEWTLRRCTNRNCGLLWLDPMPIEQDLPKLYENYFTHESPAEQFRLSGIRKAMEGAYLAARYGYLGPRSARSAVLAALLRLAPGHRAQADQTVFGLAARPGGRLLDVGCGNGAAMLRMRDLGWVVEGVDFDAEAVVHARARGLDVRLGSLEEQEYGQGTFEAVVASHVLEHVPDPRAFLRECLRILCPGGEFVCVTPNTSGRCHRRYRSSWLGLDPPRHLHIFGPPALRLMVEQLGWAYWGIATTVANTHTTEVASMRIKANGCHDLRHTPDARERLNGRVQQLCAAMQNAAGAESGEELLLHVAKD